VNLAELPDTSATGGITSRRNRGCVEFLPKDHALSQFVICSATFVADAVDGAHSLLSRDRIRSGVSKLRATCANAPAPSARPCECDAGFRVLFMMQPKARLVVRASSRGKPEWNLVVVRLGGRAALGGAELREVPPDRARGASRRHPPSSPAPALPPRTAAQASASSADHFDFCASARLLVIPGIQLEPASMKTDRPFFHIAGTSAVRPQKVTSDEGDFFAFSRPYRGCYCRFTAIPDPDRVCPSACSALLDRG